MRNTGTAGLVIGLLVIALASGCSSKGRKKIDYDAARTLPSLEIPPGLSTLPQSSSVQSGKATYSEFEVQQQRSKGEFPDLLPTFDNVRLERAGTHRWLVVKVEAEKLWPQMHDFMNSVGLTVAKERPEVGILESDWAENRANMGTGIQRFLAKLASVVGGADRMDKYRIRLERGEVPGTTEVYLSHRGMQQVVLASGASLSRKDEEVFGWKPRPSDPELEAEMLRLLMLHIGVTAPQAVAVLSTEPRPAQATMGRNESGFPALNLFDSQERAWRRVGLSLDRIGFTVEDRDRSRWTYYIRYADPQEDRKKKKKRKKKKQEETEQEYQVALKPVENGTAIEVFDQNGAPSAPKTSEQILSLLYEQLK